MTHAFVAPIVLALLVAGCGGGGEARGETAGDSARSAQPETSITMSREQVEHGGVRWSTAPSADLTNAIEVPAQVIANEDRTVHVGAPAQGRVISLHVHPGEPIRKGEVLVTLQSPAASNARSDLDKAIAQLAARRAAATYARTARERADRLLEMKAGSRQEAERARADDEAAQAEVRQADAEVARARGLVAQFGSASVTGTMLLRSPLTGIVLSRDIDPGAVAEPGTPLVAVTDPRHLWLLLSVADKVAGTLRSGSRIRFSVPAFPRDTFVARVEGIGGALDTATRMVPVHAVVESGMGRLRPAMFATAWIESGAAQRVVLVPNEAVQFLDERSVVFVARADGKGGARFERRDVTTGAPRGDRTPILSGLGTDDVIVIAGAFAVKSEFSRSKMSGSDAMIDALIAAALRYRLVVIGAVLVLVAGGAWALSQINYDAFPDLTPNQVQVITVAPGLSPNEVENLVSYPMETGMMGLPRTQGVRSISKAGLSVVTVSYDDDVDLYFARTQVQQRMLDAQASLPAGVQATLGPAATPMGEVFQYLVESRDTTLSQMELKTLQEYTIKPMLRTVPGVADVNSWGGLVRQFHVLADPVRLASYGLSLSDLEKSLAENNGNFGAGYIETRGERFTVRGLGRVSDTTDIATVVVSTREGGVPVYVRDVARVTIGAMPREGAVSRDGVGETLSGMIVMLKGANGREVVTRVENRLRDIQPLLPAGVVIRPFYNQGEVVDRTTSTVFRNLLEGGLLVTAILFLFLRNLRASLITASVIPLSLLFAFICMKWFGFSANLMSLGALDFGLIVDASVVMVENFVRHLGHTDAATAADRRAVLRRAAFEVGRPIVFGVCIIIAVYLPIFTLEGLEGRMFTPMAFTVCVAVLGSLLLALTYVPMVSSFLLLQVKEQPSRWYEAVHARYRRALDWALGHRRSVVTAGGVLLTAALASVPFLGTEFMPALDEGSVLIETRRLPSTSLPQGMSIAREVERTLLRFPEVRSVVTKVGRPELATETMGLYAGDVYVLFKPRTSWTVGSMDDLIVQMDSALGKIPGIDYNFTAPMAMRLDEAISGVRTELGIKVFGDSLPILQATAAQIARVVERVPGAADVSVDVSAGAMQVQLSLDRAALARFGLNIADVRNAVESGVGGRTASEVIDGRKRFPIVVRLDEPFRGTPEAIGALLLTAPGGARVSLSQVAQVRIVEGPELINHESGERMVIVQSNVRGRDLGGFAAEVQREVGRRVVLPQGYFVTYGGQFENQQRAMQRLAIIVPLVLALIVALLYASFGNVRQALLVMLNVPFALVGGIAALWLRGLNLNLSASVGFIALFGVAVLNGVVLLAYINQLREERGLPLADAVREGSEVRLRPVLMTALVASVGFIPMAVSTSPGAEVQRPLATVVIGGLITSTALTLIMLPVVYEWLEERWPAWRAARQASSSSAMAVAAGRN